jgi:hypothetical protein
MRRDILTADFELHMDKLLEEEEQQRGKLDDTLVRQGRYLIEVQANDDDLRLLVKRHPKGSRLYRTLATYQKRMQVARLVPDDKWNPNLPWTAHAEAARIQDPETRFKVIADPTGTGSTPVVTTQEMHEIVQQIRRDIGEITEPAALPESDDYNRSAGFAISDGKHGVIRGKITFENGEVTLTATPPPGSTVGEPESNLWRGRLNIAFTVTEVEPG